MTREGGNPVRKTSLVSFDAIYEIVGRYSTLRYVTDEITLNFEQDFRFTLNFIKVS